MLSLKASDRLKQIPQYNFNKIVAYNDKKIKQQLELVKLAEEKLLALENSKQTNTSNLKPKVIQSSSENQGAKQTAPSSNFGCKYHLIIGSFGVESNAIGLVSKMKEEGYLAQIVPSKNGSFSMVSIQCFKSIDEVSQSKSKILKESQQKGWVYAN